ATAGTRRAVIALDGVTGELRWVFSLDEGKRGELSTRRLSGRGVAYWTDGRQDERIIFITAGYQLVALDAKSGRPIPNFGHKGIVGLRTEADQERDPLTGDLSTNSPPFVAGNTIIVGAAGGNGMVPKSRKNAKGYIRGYDARTGKRLWIFH